MQNKPDRKRLEWLARDQDTLRFTDKGSHEYNTWVRIKQWCTNRNHRYYPRYGGMGISLWHYWAISYTRFLEAVGRAPTRFYVLTRYDLTGNFAPGNVYWEPRKAYNLRMALWHHDHASDYYREPSYQALIESYPELAHHFTKPAKPSVGLSQLYPNEYGIWSSIRQRIKRGDRLKDGSPVQMDPRWLVAFKSFITDVGRRPGRDYRLKVVDKSLGYRPGNVVWQPSAKADRDGGITESTH